MKEPCLFPNCECPKAPVRCIRVDSVSVTFEKLEGGIKLHISEPRCPELSVVITKELWYQLTRDSVTYALVLGSLKETWTLHKINNSL